MAAAAAFRAKGWNESSEKRKRIEQIEREEAEDNWNGGRIGMREAEEKRRRERGSEETRTDEGKKGKGKRKGKEERRRRIRE